MTSGLMSQSHQQAKVRGSGHVLSLQSSSARLPQTEVVTTNSATPLKHGKQPTHLTSPHQSLSMPGRTSTRSARSSAAGPARKSSTATLKSARTSAYAVEIPDEGPETSLRTQISNIFSDAQNTTATQRKLQITLRKLQERCCFAPPPSKKSKVQPEEDYDEEDFNNEVTRCLLRVLGVKKGEPVGDRIIRFISLFLKHALEKGEELHFATGQSLR